MRKFLIVMLLCLTSAPIFAQSVRAGVEAWQKGDPATAVTIWRPLAEKGDVDAAFNLGQAYRLGKGLPLDLGKAQFWLGKAAAKGHVDAQATLGLLLFQNGNRDAALNWLKPAADAGEARAMLIFGTALFNGDGVPRDPIKAYAYISRAAATGLAPAKATLADLDPLLNDDQKKQGRSMAAAMSSPPTKVAAKPPTSPLPLLQQAKAKPTPAAKISPPPAATPVAKGDWRIQLGAFSQRGTAQSLFAKLQGKLGGRQAYYVPVGNVVRPQTGPFESRAAAAAACARLSPQPCFPVEAR